jgi:hypothetical protein
MGVMLDVMCFQEAMILFGEAVRPTTPAPSTRPIIPAHDLATNNFGYLAIMFGRLFVAL